MKHVARLFIPLLVIWALCSACDKKNVQSDADVPATFVPQAPDYADSTMWMTAGEVSLMPKPFMSFFFSSSGISTK